MIAPKNKKEVRTLLCVLCYQSNNQKNESISYHCY